MGWGILILAALFYKSGGIAKSHSEPPRPRMFVGVTPKPVVRVTSFPSKPEEVKPKVKPEVSLSQVNTTYIYCLLKDIRADITLTGRSKILAEHHPELYTNGTVGNEMVVAVVEDPSCPKDYVSFVDARRNTLGSWHIRKSLNCVSTSPSEMYLSFSRQRTMKAVDDTDPSNYHFSFLGVGMFVTRCGSKTVLSRAGSFHRSEEGHLEDSYGCQLLNDRLNAVTIPFGDRLKSDGIRAFVGDGQRACFSSSGECIGFVTNFDLIRPGEMLSPDRIETNMDLSVIESTHTNDRNPEEIMSSIRVDTEENLAATEDDLRYMPGASQSDFDRPEADPDCVSVLTDQKPQWLVDQEAEL